MTNHLEVCDLMAKVKEWQLIKTAPKDGTRILLYREGWAEDRAVGWWNATDKRWQVVSAMMPWSGNVTHWMPLPEPPK